MEPNALSDIYHRESRTLRNSRARDWHRDNPERSYWLAAKGRARRQKLPFNIEPSDIVIPSVCPALGIKLNLDRSESKTRGDTTPSLDRIKPELGYVKGNICVISWRANRLKNSCSLEELKNLVKYVESC